MTLTPKSMYQTDWEKCSLKLSVCTHVHISGIYMLHDTTPNGDHHKIIANSYESVVCDTLSMKQVHCQ